MDETRKASSIALEALGSKKLFVLDNSISTFISSFEKLKNVELEGISGLKESEKFRLDKQSITELKQMSDYASSILSGTMAGTLGGALAGFGAFNGVHLLATSGILTGGKIFSAAATNATLAFLGGGPLASMGLGMAGGVVVLGGLVVGPALAIMGLIFSSKASENLDNAQSNKANADKIAEELNMASFICNSIRRRSNMFLRLLIRLDALFTPLVFVLETIIKEKGEEWKNFDEKDKETIAAASVIAKAITTILDTTILTDDGELTEESLQVANDIKMVVDNYENAQQ